MGSIFESGVKYYTGVVQVKIGETTIGRVLCTDGTGLFLSETRPPPHLGKAKRPLTFTANLSGRMMKPIIDISSHQEDYDLTIWH